VYEPLLIFEGGCGALLSAKLRSGKARSIDSLLPELRRIVPRLREHSPHVSLALRADAGFAAPRLYDWLEDQGLSYTIGFGSNARLKRLAEPLVARARTRFERTGEDVRMFSSLRYRARRWRRSRRVLIKVEVSSLGLNVRFAVTNRTGGAQDLFDWYNDRASARTLNQGIRLILARDPALCLERLDDAQLSIPQPIRFRTDPMVAIAFQDAELPRRTARRPGSPMPKSRSTPSEPPAADAAGSAAGASPTDARLVSVSARPYEVLP